MFFSSKKKIVSALKQRTILVIGGSGVLGRTFAERKPENVTIINISRQGSINGKDIFNHHHDILKNPEKLLKELAETTGSVDVLINMAYDRQFSSIEKLDRNIFLSEIELDVFSPLHVSILVGKNFWSKENRGTNIAQNRKVINISSGAAFGKTSRPELASYGGAKAALNVMTEYLHDYLLETFGVSAHIVAPGALQNPATMDKTVSTIWELQGMSADKFTVQKTF